MVGLLSSVDGLQSLNESPHPKAGKWVCPGVVTHFTWASMKVPTRRRGNIETIISEWAHRRASMKVPTRRRGNNSFSQNKAEARRLNESPHPKAGKF